MSFCSYYKQMLKCQVNFSTSFYFVRETLGRPSIREISMYLYPLVDSLLPFTEACHLIREGSASCRKNAVMR